METKSWYAWINYMPPPPDELHVTGRLFVANPGVEAQLVMRQPQGINPSVLLLDLHLVQRPGMWPQVMTWIQARYSEVLTPTDTRYTQVQVLSEGNLIATMDVDSVR